MRGEKGESKKQAIRSDYRIHKLHNNAFYDFIKERREDFQILIFDHQPNQVGLLCCYFENHLVVLLMPFEGITVQR